MNEYFNLLCNNQLIHGIGRKVGLWRIKILPMSSMTSGLSPRLSDPTYTPRSTSATRKASIDPSLFRWRLKKFHSKGVMNQAMPSIGMLVDCAMQSLRY